MAILIMSLKDNIIHHIANFNDPTQGWQALHNHDNKNAVCTMLLFNQLHSTKMDERSSMVDYLQKISKITTELRSSGEEVSKLRLVHIALNGLPQEYEGLVQGLLVLDELPNFEKLIGKLLVEEARLCRQTTQHFQALVFGF